MQHILNLIRGALIGSAELVPGISGGTVALIVGIYERALHNANLLIKGKIKEVDWLFLLTVGVGMVVAVFGMSTVLSSFVDNNFSISHALFMGMVAVSMLVPISMMSKEDRAKPQYWIYALVAAVVIFVMTGFTSEAVEDPNLIVIFFAAAVAVCALIMPGVSGSLILLMLGLYQPTIAAVSDGNFTVIIVFIVGAICGLAAFVRTLNYLLDSHRGATLAVMTGFMLGSLRALWPWGEGQDAGSLPIIAMLVLGGAIVGGFIFADTQIAKKKAAA
ncbi:MAG: DUF368 domain-containing protein [Corynebacterium casei]|uniref:DUF368 domain-containing protein n=1 Tax=Corynebacterium casei UCMA 3821 TaxID=1110505 RepID=G7HZK7_9CORY|nr:DUF368 domain-containing protein [Corynebacterium casei]MDN5705964.1 DUF368 domain-containing protein [Corynebacterium casei]MDN5729193.1 DUF368 domain-containing protein [Corynebacterium casei]MDN5741276.1 DUF368 domain-containing protein [Corynebacterium casei]MDN5800087.1 DUF368 domain-containing protein [Corynebacterium casei]MDN5826618.1 DUF368 domain-containing protein [Corynebacterium casei]